MPRAVVGPSATGRKLQDGIEKLVVPIRGRLEFIEKHHHDRAGASKYVLVVSDQFDGRSDGMRDILRAFMNALGIIQRDRKGRICALDGRVDRSTQHLSPVDAPVVFGSSRKKLRTRDPVHPTYLGDGQSTAAVLFFNSLPVKGRGFVILGHLGIPLRRPKGSIREQQEPRRQPREIREKGPSQSAKVHQSRKAYQCPPPP